MPGTDEQALENARRGCAEARMMSVNEPTPAEKSRPNRIVRVNSVPVLSPHTPADRIRRTLTPTPPVPTSGGVSGPPTVVPLAESHRLQREAIFEKRLRPAGGAMTLDDGAPSAPTTGDMHQQHAVGEGLATPGALPDAPAAQSLNATNGDEPLPKASTEPKQTAKKAAAKPPMRHEATEAGVVKQQPTPCRNESKDDAAREKAHAENLARANTASQMGTPAPHQRPNGDVSPMDEDSQPHDADDKCDDGDLEDELEKEMKKENDADCPAAPAPVVPPVGERPVKAARKEKTPEQKAAHARYMRFSRSFERTLSIPRSVVEVETK